MQVKVLAQCPEGNKCGMLWMSLSLLLIIIILRGLIKMEKVNFQADCPQGHFVPVIW